MSDIRFNTWLHQSGTGGITQVDGGHVGIGTTNPDIAVHTANAKKVNVGIVTANSVYATNFYGNGSNLTGIDADKILEGDTKVEVVDSGDQYIVGEVNGNERIRIDSAGKITHTATTNNTATLDLYGGNTTVSATGEVNAQLRFRSKDNSVTNSEENVGGVIKSITEFNNGAYVGMAFETYMQNRTPRLKEAFRVSYNGQIGLMGPNYGTAGQVLTSQGSGSPVQWASPATPYGGALDGMIFGGVETTYTSGGTTYKVHSFLSTGFLRVTAATTMDFLIVAGGGGSPQAEGYSGSSGGGGAGGMVEGSSISIPAGKHTLTVGAGGAASNQYTVGGTGGDSTFVYGGTTITAKGGGGGADYASTGGTGGSGGGGAEPNTAAGSSNQSSQNSGISGISQYGNAGGQGGNYTGSNDGSGGGGGAGGAGNARSSGGAGGSGRANSITGSSVTYAAGGAGGTSGVHSGTAGTNGRGNGASGASAAGSEGSGAAGGSGIIIVRYVLS